ncbi:Glutamate receptor [Olea europaea subsp. europaea]|uniref:Glutamate receptor n=1 Tax=Olea europaea subsp. europaea TaxID=158383 RepID=A0A8S0R4W5_OLEEU|nr:Glutamate receptor [Olea europaea subsp. europaea]
MALETTLLVKVGVILDMNTTVGKMGLECIKMALSDFYASHGYYKTKLILHTRDSKGNVVDAARAPQDLLNNVEVKAIIGPQQSTQANFVINLGNNSKIPIISFSATNPSLTSLRSAYFIRATLNDSAQLEALTSIVKAFGWREIVPIYVDNEFGEGIIPYLTDLLQDINARIPYRSVIHPFASDEEIVAELYKLKSMPTRVFIVHMQIPLGTRLFKKVEEVGMMSKGYVWIMTNGMTNLLSLMDPLVIDSLQGVLGVKPHVPKSKRYEEFTVRWNSKHKHEMELNIFGLWAYDAATALARATENSDHQNFNNLSQVLSTSTSFRGLSGEFHIVNGQLQSSTFQIVNVQGEGEIGIGFWTRENGFLRRLSVKNMSKYNISKDNLKPVIWPGEITSVPKGWVTTSNGKKLRIGVPSTTFFPELVEVIRDSSKNLSTVKGYCIDVFNAVMEILPYSVPYEFIPFQKPNGESAGSYNDLTYQVYLENYDAVVGDVTILANRSSYVDFTLPYAESGVRLLVPLKEKKKNAWIFLRPLTWQLWLTSGCCFLGIGLVILILENRNTSGSQQICRSFWSTFTHIVHSNKEEVVNNVTKFVVIIWCFVVLILTQSYTASLSSMLTVQQLKPSITDIHELIKSGQGVAYHKNSFVLGLLEQLKVPKSQMKTFRTPADLHTALQNGSVAGLFDEIPYLNLFRAKSCSKYTLVEPTSKADGFGFVFPRGSPLVSDVSRAILEVTEGEKMRQIEKKWFGEGSCADTSSSTSNYSKNLGLGSFWGLFLVVGIASMLALIVSLGLFLFEKRRALINYFLNRSKVLATNEKNTEDESSNTTVVPRSGTGNLAHTRRWQSLPLDQKYISPSEEESSRKYRKLKSL